MFSKELTIMRYCIRKVAEKNGEKIILKVDKVEHYVQIMGEEGVEVMVAVDTGYPNVANMWNIRINTYLMPGEKVEECMRLVRIANKAIKAFYSRNALVLLENDFYELGFIKKMTATENSVYELDFSNSSSYGAIDLRMHDAKVEKIVMDTELTFDQLVGISAAIKNYHSRLEASKDDSKS